jgi:division protein CdvB (Snf7/Vps24/ESCRT-III family)
VALTVVITVVSRLLQALGLGAQGGQEDIVSRIDHVIVRLEAIEDRIAEIRYGLEKRSQELFRKVVEYLRRGEKSRATIYAGEVSQIRSLLKLMVTMENVVIMTKERLKTVRDMKELTKTLMVFSAALSTVKDEVTALYPNMSMVFEEISKSARSLVMETSVEAMADIDPTVVSLGAQEVLEEAARKAEEKIRQEFPEPPVEPVVNAKPTPLSQQAAILAAASLAARRPSDAELDQLVLDYIRSHNGTLDIRDFTARYGVTKEDVARALHRLAERGLIALA